MGWLDWLFPKRPEPAPRFVITTGWAATENDDHLAVVSAGGVSLPAAIYKAYQRDVQDWSSGIRIEDPQTGRWLRETSTFPAAFQAAGAHSISVAGIEAHPDASLDVFGTGRIVRLVPEPTNPVDPRAIAIVSADGRHRAGHVPADELDEILDARPVPTVGLVTWDNFTWRPRTRIGMRLLIGPNVRLALVPDRQVARERARRQATYAACREAEMRQLEQERAVREQRERQAAAWRAEGRCVDCGGSLVPGKRFVRCAQCRRPV